jgi:hypothetical protein
MDAVDMYVRYTGRWLRESVPFVPWFAATYPDTIQADYPEPRAVILGMMGETIRQYPQHRWKPMLLEVLENGKGLEGTD